MWGWRFGANPSLSMSDHVQKMADDLVEKLGEHCDSVRVFCTYPEGGGETSGYSSGSGNFFAQHGQIHEWLIRQDEIVRAHARKQQEGES